jgi:hypothetical protein
VLLLSRLAELAASVALGGVEHREVAPREGELEKLEQERIPVWAWGGDAAGELVEILESDAPEGEQLADRDALAAPCFPGGVEEAAVGACVWWRRSSSLSRTVSYCRVTSSWIASVATASYECSLRVCSVVFLIASAISARTALSSSFQVSSSTPREATPGSMERPYRSGGATRVELSTATRASHWVFLH